MINVVFLKIRRMVIYIGKLRFCIVSIIEL